MRWLDSITYPMDMSLSAAFVALGLLLLTGSVFYTRFKERLNP